MIEETSAPENAPPVILRLNVGGYQDNNKWKSPHPWTIVDINVNSPVRVNLNMDRMPFDNNSVAAIYTSHTIEHIYIDRLQVLFNDFYRIMQDGAVIRVVVPDFDIALKAYMNGDYEFLQRNNVFGDVAPSLPLYQLLSWGYCYQFTEGERIMVHKSPMNSVVLGHFMANAGFQDITKKSYCECDEVFVGCDFEDHKETSLYMEARK